MTVLLASALLAGGALAQKPPPLGAQEAVPRGNTVMPAGKPPPLPPGASAAEVERRAVSSGTGFIVARSQILTNHHVVEGCAEMRVKTASGAELPGTVAATDEQRDLALLTVHGDPGPPLSFRSGPAVRRGEGVVTYGFPLAGLLSSGPTLTTGDVSALSGLRDNPRQYQISAPVQPGNSGGPLLDYAGNVAGVVVSKLNAQRIAQNTGDIPQNVNFAVKAEEAVEFLRRNGVQPALATSEGRPRSAAEVGDLANPSTVFLRCLR
ncbi:MAG TPA: serine protease [Crenalkalicoccus sp.]|nr:serine protease [Crenalkalicoccus sp.]